MGMKEGRLVDVTSSVDEIVYEILVTFGEFVMPVSMRYTCGIDDREIVVGAG